MNKLPIPFSSPAPAPALRPVTYGVRGEDEARVERLENRARLASGRFSLRRPPEPAPERPGTGSGGFEGTRGASSPQGGAKGAYSLPYGASAGFLAQLIGQAIETNAMPGPALTSDGADTGNALYRKASEELNAAGPANSQYNIAV
ncbi:MAG: hypothetical protein QNJ67_05790 [Kiloniellales bacterium]|nr:hypothetical protein [Kiloniellales bacterium]